jgi:peroxiredoxin
MLWNMKSRIPHTVFKTRVRDEAIAGDNPYRWQDRSSEEIFAGKRVVLFALPGAFTPTCSSTHLPGYEAHYDELRAQGIDEVICLSVNDAFVMFQWGEKLGVQKVKLLPDGNAELTRKLGMLVDKSDLGFGLRSWRYSAVIDDGRIVQAFVEPGFGDLAEVDPFEISDVHTMLDYLRSEAHNVGRHKLARSSASSSATAR